MYHTFWLKVLVYILLCMLHPLHMHDNVAVKAMLFSMHLTVS